MPDWPAKSEKSTPWSEEDVCIVSKRDPCMVWAGTKVMFSGLNIHDQFPNSGLEYASGYNFLSGEGDVEVPSLSGWGEIRIPEIGELHKIFVFPKDPRIIARPAYIMKPAAYPASGIGSCSGKIAMLKWAGVCPSVGTCSGFIFVSGAFNSGELDVIAFGSIY